MTKYPYAVKKDGRYYPAGAEVPASQDVISKQDGKLVEEVKVEKKKTTSKNPSGK